MNYLKRDLEATLLRYAKFPVVAVLGPRQSGKTTLAKEVFSRHRYVNLEDPEKLAFITEDPKRFLREYENDQGIIIDEFQHAPEFLSYVQIEADEKDRPGYFVLTGSQNFLMNQAITQSLAGRVGILHLLPLSIHELNQAHRLPATADELILYGGYPRLYARDFTPEELFPSYIRTYVERDVRQLLNVTNLSTFQKFMSLCAGRIGQLLNLADIATNCNIDRRTAQDWLSILEASYIVFRLEPYFNNFNKRLTKSPKLYFNDTGLACALLGLTTAREIANSPFRGALFESLVVADLYKQFYNAGKQSSLYFWREQNGRLEVDCLIKLGNNLFPVEIKSGETITTDFFKAMTAWQQISEEPATPYIIYGGSSVQRRTAGHVIPLAQAGELIATLEKE